VSVDSTLEEGGVMMAEEMCGGGDVASRAAGRWRGADRSSSCDVRDGDAPGL